ncbi:MULTISPECIES: alpha/beta hydrolase family protein [Fusobacterium]|uniref:alpha/beta hydrolase n=1 Tax=Fusobacterium TaxID=848 RepID=UPI0014775AF9|nr:MULTISPECIES: alpha/beta hydrolase-fold protein [Fusobacterium]NME35485.1 esterase [Fusobacterium sp. FSA-380-WT-3A]
MIKLLVVIIVIFLLFYLDKMDKKKEKTLKRKLERVKSYKEVISLDDYEKIIKKYSLEEIDEKVNIQEKFITSKHVNERMRYLLITPKNQETKNLPLVFLFHGIRDYPEDWITRGMLLENYFELLEKKLIKPMMFIIPAAGFNGESWYSNFYKDEKHKYENYIMDELYKEAKKISNGKIGIAGFSMGGYAALKIGLKHIEEFQIIGSFSGAVSIIRMSLNRRVIRFMKYLYIPRIFFKGSQDKINFLKIFSPWGWRILKQDPYTIIKNMEPEKFKGKSIYISVGEEDKEPYLMLQQWTDIVGRLKKYNVDFQGYIYKNQYHTWSFISKDIENFLKYFSEKIDKEVEE